MGGWVNTVASFIFHVILKLAQDLASRMAVSGFLTHVRKCRPTGADG